MINSAEPAVRKDSLEATIQIYSLIRERMHQMQSIRWSWCQYSIIGTFASIAWLASEIKNPNIENQQIFLFAAYAPFLFNMWGLMSDFGLKKSIEDRAHFLNEIEHHLFEKIPRWEERLREIDRSRGHATFDRSIPVIFWLTLVAISALFPFVVWSEM